MQSREYQLENKNRHEESDSVCSSSKECFVNKIKRNAQVIKLILIHVPASFGGILEEVVTRTTLIWFNV
jgi:hypothetical protein